MIVKVREKFENTGNVKNNDESGKCILLGEGNVRYYDRVLPESKERPQKLAFS